MTNTTYKIRYIYTDGITRHIGEFYCNSKESIIRKCVQIRNAHPDVAFVRV